MSQKNSILKHILQIIPRHELGKSEKKRNGEFASKGNTISEQFVSILFAPLSGQTGLRGRRVKVCNCSGASESYNFILRSL